MKDELTKEQKAAAWDSTKLVAFEGTAILDPKGVIAMPFPPFCEILKLSPAELVGVSYVDLFPFPQKTIIQRNVNRVILGLESSYTDEAMMILPDGRTLPVIVMFTASFLRDGTVDFIIKRIMESQPQPFTKPASSSDSRKASPWQWLKENYKMIGTIGAALAVIASELLKKIPA